MTRARTSLAAVLALLVGASGAYWYLHRPVQQTSYYGIALSDEQSEVQYKLGVPPHVVGPRGTGSGWRADPLVYDVDGDPATDKSALPRGQNFADFDEWSYTAPSGTGGRLDVSFDPKTKKVWEIACFSSSVEPES
jgi:hypothetical protein